MHLPNQKVEYGFVIGQNKLNTVKFSLSEIGSDDKIADFVQYGCRDGFAITESAITWSFLRAVLIKNVENFENIIYSDHEEWPLKAKEKVKNGLMKILDEKYHDLELRRGFENLALEKFYECQRNILKKFMCELKMNKIYEI